MSKAKFPEFVRSTEYRRELGIKRKRAIKKMYSDIAKETENKINAIQRAGKWTGTTVLQMKQLRDLQKSIDDSLKNISAQIEKDIVSDMKKVAEVTCADVAGMMKRIGVNVGAAYAHVPELAVKNIVSGNLYGQRWNFSKAVWGDYRKASGDLAQIVAKGLAQNRPIYDIAKDLEKYVNPNVRKDFDWSRRYPGSKKKVDYNAYRLAQTMSTHAHQQAVIIANRDNPLFDGVEWHSSGSSRTCPLCEQRNGEIFPFDKCPMDHPMGQCTLSPHLKNDSRTAAERIGDWIGGKSDDPELDKFAETLGYTDKSQMAVKPVNNAASSGASANNAAEKLSQIQKASDELGKAVKNFGKSVDGFENAVGNLQNAAKGLTSGGGYSKMATISSNDWSQALPKVHTKSELDELCSYAKERGIKIYNPTAFDGDSNVLRKQIDTIYGIKTEYNINSKITVTFANMLDDDFAETINNTIYFNKKVLRDATITNLNLNADNQLAATDFTGISVHEMGHIISRKYGEKGLDIAKKAYYNIYKEKISTPELLQFLNDNISEYSVFVQPGYDPRKIKYIEITPEIMSKSKSTNSNKFSQEFIRLLKEAAGI